MAAELLLERIADGRTDLVWAYVGAGHSPSAQHGGVALLQWCAYYGDVSAIRFLLDHGEALSLLGQDRGLNGAAFHGHWQLCEFLLESGADVNTSDADTQENVTRRGSMPTKSMRSRNTAKRRRAW